MQTENKFADTKPGKLTLASRRASYYDIADVLVKSPFKLEQEDLAFFETIDVIYRTLCAALYNFVPTSGHPGGSVSSGRIVQGLLYNTMDYELSSPQRPDSDMISYAAGHKAMGMYAMWALRNELVRAGDPDLLPVEKFQLRLEDLLGFRRNPTNDTPLFKKFHSKPLDGHPTCATPFIKTATGASGVGVGASLGLALGAMDIYPANPPRMNMIEGEGGLTPGRVGEALAAAATAQMKNVFLHVDWNQSSIDSDKVCAENSKPGDYVQWNPAELAYVNDWNVIYVPNGHDFYQILAAQELSLTVNNGQPTAVIYRTVKGWKYGIEGRSSHGAGHKFASDGYYSALAEFENRFEAKMPRFSGASSPAEIEKCFYDTLMTVRSAIEKNPSVAKTAAAKIQRSKNRLDAQKRYQKSGAPDIEKLYNSAYSAQTVPDALKLAAGKQVTLRDALGDAIGFLNGKTNGAFFACAADLCGSTSVTNTGKGFPPGFYNAASNPGSRIIAVGGICEDAMGALMTGLASYGRHIGVTSSYSAFIAALEHVPARLHGIGQQTMKALTGKPYNTFIMINAHAGVKTGEDGPTHADPQALQLLQENFPQGSLITLTPWEPQEIWPLLITGLLKRPAVLCPFVTRPPEIIIDRAQAGLPEPAAAAKGIYALMKADADKKPYHGTIVLQGNGVASIFIAEVLPEIKKQGLNLNVFYVSSMELFQMLAEKERDTLYPQSLAMEAMGMTDFTLPTMYFWVRSGEGIRRTLHSFRNGHYLGSGQAHKVFEEAGLHGKGQLQSVLDYAAHMEKRPASGKKRTKAAKKINGEKTAGHV